MTKKIQLSTGRILKAGDLVSISTYYSNENKFLFLEEEIYPNNQLIVIDALDKGLSENSLIIYGHIENSDESIRIMTRENFIKKDVLQTIRHKLENISIRNKE